MPPLSRPRGAASWGGPPPPPSPSARGAPAGGGGAGAWGWGEEGGGRVGVARGAVLLEQPRGGAPGAGRVGVGGDAHEPAGECLERALVGRAEAGVLHEHDARLECANLARAV